MQVHIAHTSHFLVATDKIHQCLPSHHLSHIIGRTKRCLFYHRQKCSCQLSTFQREILTPPFSLAPLLLISGEEVSLLMVNAYVASWAWAPPLLLCQAHLLLNPLFSISTVDVPQNKLWILSGRVLIIQYMGFKTPEPSLLRISLSLVSIRYNLLTYHSATHPQSLSLTFPQGFSAQKSNMCTLQKIVKLHSKRVK